ncbi:MAG: putative rane protein [Pseudomonas sp.]|nr:putative rane protein [Pseudomonas sp.]
MLHVNGHFQSGMTLIEVLISLLILAIGLLGAATVQLNALKYTDSAMLHSQASFIAYDLMDRIRANPDANYTLTSLTAAPASGNLNVPRDQDLFDFANNITAFAGPQADANVNIDNRAVKITITWNDSRAANETENLQTFTLNSRVAIDRSVVP